MIKHSVVFTLKCQPGSLEEQQFLKAAAELAGIPGVENFESLRQISPKTNYDFGLSMEFASQELYDQYNIHPLHTRFIQQYWMPFVKDFMELDFKSLPD